MIAVPGMVRIHAATMSWATCQRTFKNPMHRQQLGRPMERFKGMPKEQANIYRQRAAECEALARHYENTPLGKYFLELAEQWRQLADRTERSESGVKTMLRLFGYNR
jgi:hypothetical protein